MKIILSSDISEQKRKSVEIFLEHESVYNKNLAGFEYSVELSNALDTVEMIINSREFDENDANLVALFYALQNIVEI